jgi:C-terminal processing protease CtpA/Prc
VLTNGGTYSTAEVLAASLKDAGRALLVGGATGGGASNKIGVLLPGGLSASFATVDGRRADGRPFEGVGVTPDVAVAEKGDALRAGHDPILDAGLQEARTRARSSAHAR